MKLPERLAEGWSQWDGMGALAMVVPLIVTNIALARVAHPFGAGFLPGKDAYLGEVCGKFCFGIYLNFVGAAVPLVVTAMSLPISLRFFLFRSSVMARRLTLSTIGITLLVLGLTLTTTANPSGRALAENPYILALFVGLIGGSIAYCSRTLGINGLDRRTALRVLSGTLFTFSTFTIIALWGDLIGIPWALLTFHYVGLVPNAIGGAGVGDGLFLIPLSTSCGYLIWVIALELNRRRIFAIRRTAS